MLGLSEDRLIEVRKMSNDEWVDTCGLHVDDPAFEEQSDVWQAKTEAFCSGATDPRELHYFVETFNWDSDIAFLEAIARNPACEAATALLIYWRGQPEFYLDNPSSAVELMSDEFELIRTIETRYVAGGFKVGICSYDPFADNMVLQPEHRRLPAVVYEPVVGSYDRTT